MKRIVASFVNNFHLGASICVPCGIVVSFSVFSFDGLPAMGAIPLLLLL